MGCGVPLLAREGVIFHGPFDIISHAVTFFVGFAREY
jgi:hypothetical protein